MKKEGCNKSFLFNTQLFTKKFLFNGKPILQYLLVLSNVHLASRNTLNKQKHHLLIMVDVLLNVMEFSTICQQSNVFSQQYAL